MLEKQQTVVSSKAILFLQKLNWFFPQGGLLMHDASDIMEQLIGEDDTLSVPATSTQVKEESQGDSVSVLESVRGSQTNQVITHTQRLVCKDEGCGVFLRQRNHNHPLNNSGFKQTSVWLGQMCPSDKAVFRWGI